MLPPQQGVFYMNDPTVRMVHTTAFGLPAVGLEREMALCHSHGGLIVISCSSQYSMTDVTKAMVSNILYVGWCIIKEPLLLIEKNSPCGRSEFPLII